jgi:ABC-type sugar transport system ATPase subunit
LSLYEGDCFGIIGLHDSGKSLLLKVINGDEDRDSGQIYFNETLITHKQLAKSRSIYLINEASALIPTLSVLENVFVIRKRNSKNIFIAWNKLEQQLTDCLTELEIKMDIQQPVKDLSFAERHIVEIVKAYLFGAKIIMADNITAHYTYQEQIIFQRLIHHLQSNQIAFILTGYQLSSLKRYVDHLLFLVKGSNVKTIRNFADQPVDENRILFGSAIKAQRKQVREYPEIAFEAKHVSTEPGEDCSFQVKKGEIVVFVDFPSQTNANLIQSLVGQKKFQGEFSLFGRRIKKSMLRKAICIADYEMDNLVINSLNLKDNLCLSVFPRISKLNFVSKRQEGQITKDFLDLFTSENYNYTFDIKNLSQPEAMAIYLYRILIQKWRLLICTNPEMLFSYETVTIIKKLMRRMTENGRTICIFASTIEQYEDLADYYYLVSNGQIRGKLTYTELYDGLSQLNGAY